MEQLGKLIIQATGGIYIGETFFRSFRCTWPFAKIKIYEDSIILKVQYVQSFTFAFLQLMRKLFPKMMEVYIGRDRDSTNILKDIKLSYSDIKGYKKQDFGLPLGHSITIVHTNNQYSPFLQVWVSKNKSRAIVRYLNSRGICEQKLNQEDLSMAMRAVFGFLRILGNKKLQILFFIFLAVSGIVIYGMLILQHWVVGGLDLGEKQAEMARDWMEKSGQKERQIEIVE